MPIKRQNISPSKTREGNSIFKKIEFVRRVMQKRGDLLTVLHVESVHTPAKRKRSTPFRVERKSVEITKFFTTATYCLYV